MRALLRDCFWFLIEVVSFPLFLSFFFSLLTNTPGQGTKYITVPPSWLLIT